MVLLLTPQVFLDNPSRLLARGLDGDSDLSGFPALGGLSVVQFGTFGFAQGQTARDLARAIAGQAG